MTWSVAIGIERLYDDGVFEALADAIDEWARCRAARSRRWWPMWPSATWRASPSTRRPWCRPHVNVIVDLEVLETRGQGRLADGSLLDATTVQRLACDAGLHRVVTAGRSTILDYGTTTRTVPPPLFAALVVRDGHCRFGACGRPPQWARPTTSSPWPRVGPPAWTTWCWPAAATTTCGSAPGGT
jgi:hypothetical protein